MQNEGAYKVLAKATALESQGKNIVHLEIGQPGFPTPPHIVDAGRAALAGGDTKYSNPTGVAGLREAIAAEVSATRGVEVSPEEVVVGPGAKPGLFFPALALLNPGDEVIFPDPGFPTYAAMVQVAGAVAKPVRLRADGASLDMDHFRSLLSPRTRLIVLNSPSNPTGGVMPASDLAEVAAAAKAIDGCWVLSDEIYSRLTYTAEGGAPSIYALEGMRERCILVDGFSKTYCMTGWRLGWAVMPAALARKVELLLVHSVGCTASFTQAAGVAALTGPQEALAEMREAYRARRDLVVGALNAMDGVACPTPAGAFYAFPDISALGLPSADVADVLLTEGGVALLPGTDFGRAGEGHIRISYVSDIPVLEEGLERIERTLRKLR